MRLAQLDRAFGYGPKGRGFESSNARWLVKVEVPCEIKEFRLFSCSKLYFGEKHIFTFFRDDKLCDIDTGSGREYNIITGNCNYLHFLEVRSVRLWNQSGETYI